MIEDLDETIRQLLVAEMPITNGDIDIKFHQPKREWSSRLTKPTINFFLYDLRENVVLRRHQWETMSNGAPGASKQIARMKRTPFRLDCHYMMTFWATEPEDEHQLLSSAMLALFRFPVIPKERLMGVLSDQAFDVKAQLASHDKLTNPAEVWGALDNEIRPSISYMITLAFDPWSVEEAPMTTTFTLRTGQSSRPEAGQLNEDGISSIKNSFGGHVLKDDEPQDHVRVTIKGMSFGTVTDENGRFIFGSLPSGDYTLIAWPEEHNPVEKNITVPAPDGNYDISI
jgi:hypothetical protein